MSPKAKPAAREPSKSTVYQNQKWISWTLADGLGLTAFLSMATWSFLSWLDNPLYSLVILTAGSFACAPFGIRRWASGIRPSGVEWVPVGAATALLAWAVISAVGSGAPWAVSLYGWEGRNDGLLALIAMVLLALCATTLTRREVSRLLSWLLAAGAVLIVQGVAQLAGADVFGTSTIEGVWAALGNPNFYGAMCGILAALALAKALDPASPRNDRIASGLLYLGLSAGSYFSASVQGPATFVIASFTVLVLRAIQLRTWWRAWIAIGALAAVTIGVAATVLGLVGVGPMTWLWDSPSTGFRKMFWDSSLRMANAMPVFGTGPDGMARYIGQYRTEESVRVLGYGDYLSAAHNVPLQYAATIGYIGMLAWLVLMATALLILVAAAWRSSGLSPWQVAGVGGALAGYSAQALVSIDALDLKAVGWLLLGLAIAVTGGRETSPEAANSWSIGRSVGASAGAGLAGLVLCLPMVAVVSSATSVTTVEEAHALVTGPVLPCRNRVAVLEQITGSVPADVAGSVVQGVETTDLRCPGLTSDLARTSLLSGDVARARSLAAFASTSDPYLARGWLVAANIAVSEDDTPSALRALNQAQALNDLSPDPLITESLVALRDSLTPSA